MPEGEADVSKIVATFQDFAQARLSKQDYWLLNDDAAQQGA